MEHGHPRREAWDAVFPAACMMDTRRCWAMRGSCMQPVLGRSVKCLLGLVLQDEVPKPPQEEEFMLAQLNEMRRQLQAQQLAAAQKKVCAARVSAVCSSSVHWGTLRLWTHQDWDYVVCTAMSCRCRGFAWALSQPHPNCQRRYPG